MSIATRWLAGAAGLVALAGAVPLAAQQPVRKEAAPGAIAELRISVVDDTAKAAVLRSGVLPFDRQGLNLVLAVGAVDAAGKPVPLGRNTPKWTTSDENVVSLYSDPNGASMRVVAQQDGRATLSVAAAGKTVSVPVIVGKARLEIAASELTPAFRVARLEIVELQAGSNGAKLTGTTVSLTENGENMILGARAYNADGGALPLEEFPVAWSTSDSTVIQIFQTANAQTWIAARAPGTAKITALIQGVSAVVDGTVRPALETAAAPRRHRGRAAAP